MTPNGFRAVDVRRYVCARFLETGDYLDVSEVMRQFATSAAKVHRALETDFVFSKRDDWKGDAFSGRNGTVSIVRPDAWALREYIARYCHHV